VENLHSDAFYIQKMGSCKGTKCCKLNLLRYGKCKITSLAGALVVLTVAMACISVTNGVHTLSFL